MTEHILVVNDTQDILDIFRALLEDEGYTVTVSSFPLQRIEEVEHLKPDLIILDLVFKQEKVGWQMLQMLKMYPKTASIPIILCTAAEQAVREMEGYLVSKNVHVVYKPFELNDLLSTVQQALQMRQKTMSQLEKEEDASEQA